MSAGLLRARRPVGFVARQFRCGDSDLLTAGHPRVDIARVIAFDVDEQSAGVVNAWRSNLLQDEIFADAFLRGFRIFDDVAAAAVQQAMTSAGGSVGEILFFQENSGNAAEGEIP